MHPEFSPKDVERFWSKVDRSGGPDACWPWVGRRNKHGYGAFDLWKGGRVHVQAHRAAFFLHYGAYPEPCGLHRCDNPPCCNPAHIWEGTTADNTRDCIAKGRARKALGERASRSKLTEPDVRDIRRRYAAGERCISIARDYPVGDTAIQEIVARRNWKHLD
jgi:hypothetical protein